MKFISRVVRRVRAREAQSGVAVNMEGLEMMTDERREQTTGAETDPARDNEENELEAEQESAEAMDAEVPQPDEAPQAGGTS